MTTIRRVRCPTCGASVEWTPAAKHRPFCSERCRQIDLGAWASEAYRVAARPSDTEEDPPGKAFDQARQIP